MGWSLQELGWNSGTPVLVIRPPARPPVPQTDHPRHARSLAVACRGSLEREGLLCERSQLMTMVHARPSLQMADPHTGHPAGTESAGEVDAAAPRRWPVPWTSTARLVCPIWVFRARRSWCWRWWWWWCRRRLRLASGVPPSPGCHTYELPSPKAPYGPLPTSRQCTPYVQLRFAAARRILRTSYMNAAESPQFAPPVRMRLRHGGFRRLSSPSSPSSSSIVVLRGHTPYSEVRIPVRSAMWDLCSPTSHQWVCPIRCPRLGPAIARSSSVT
jgi:hypothetical protein